MDIIINVKDVVRNVIERLDTKSLIEFSESKEADVISWTDNVLTSLELLYGLENKVWKALVEEVNKKLGCGIPKSIRGSRLARLKRLVPNGHPKYVLCYDSGSDFFDRYTVVFTGRYVGGPVNQYNYVSMSDRPFSPQGFCQHGEVDNHAGLGKRIKFSLMPEDCQLIALRDYLYFWGYCGVRGDWLDSKKLVKLCDFE